jgi:hypothetical protein
MRRVFFRNKQVAGWNGDGRPGVDETRIAFNGIGDESHESCVITKLRSKDFNFCKTARKSYDRYVTACLILCDYFAPGALNISSDGDATDWKAGMQVAEVALAAIDLGPFPDLPTRSPVIPPRVRGEPEAPKEPEGTTMTRVLSADDILKEMVEMLSEADGDFIAEIANRVFSDQVVYKGDSIFEIVKFTPA